LAEEQLYGVEEGLRVTSDSLLATLDELQALEAAKRTVQPGTSEFSELADRIERLAVSVLEASRRQASLAGEAASSGVDERSIDDIPPRPIHAVLADWREAERVVTTASPGSEEWDHARTTIRRLRDEYRRAHEAARERNDS
jgi:hypothetical protein